jgi:UDP-2-acetamido-3-amino-2,3-dideoxy-glucuronate N-acetyltransferase
MRKNNRVFIHKTSRIENNVTIGKGTAVWHFSHIMEGAIIGENCKIGQNVFIGKDVRTGNNVKIQNNVSVYSGVTLQDDVFCGPSAVFTNIKFPRSAYPRNSDEFYLKTLVKRGATIGANATIVCGITLGAYSFIGAGSVVTKDVLDFAMVFGTPARFKYWVCECGERLILKSPNKHICQNCKKEFLKENNKIRRIT